MASGPQESGVAARPSRVSRSWNTSALLLVVVAAAIPGGAFGGLTGAFVGAPLRAMGLGRGSYVAVSLRPSKPVVGALRMAREDGGSDKISKPGQGKPVGPGQGGGVGPNEGGGAGEQERQGGAGVAVLTKPPDLDKVLPRTMHG